MTTDIREGLATFLQELTAAMGVPLKAVGERVGRRVPHRPRGRRRRAAAVAAWRTVEGLQHIVSTAFRRQLGDDRRVLVDCQHFRRDKDSELHQMAKFLADKAVRTGVPQEIGPLNAYERRIVHLAVAEEGASSESVGDAAVKTVIISPK